MEYVVPALVMIIIIIGLARKKAVYSEFIEGAGEGMKILADIFPPLVAMLVAVEMLRASGAMELFLNAVSPIVGKIGIPKEVMPLVITRPMSGSGSIGVLSGILNDYGADSVIGRIASVICGSTETTFYCLAVYFAKTRVKSVQRAIPAAIIGDLASIMTAVLVIKIIGL